MFGKIVIASVLPLIAGLLISLYLPSAAVHAETEEQNIWSVVIGISHYPFLEEPCNGDCVFKRPADVPYAANNAMAVYQLLCSYGKEEQSKLLLDEKATKSDIYYSIKWLAQEAEPNDTVVLYFSGLSLAPAAFSEMNIPYYTLDSRAGYLAPYESGSTLSAQVDNEIPYLYRSWYRDRDYDIAASELAGWLDMLPAQKILIILDVNYAGSLAGDLSNYNRVVMMSSRGDEQSLECSEFEHSIFTKYILQGLTDPEAAGIDDDFNLSAEDLFSFAERMTENTISACNGSAPSAYTTQHPILADHYPGSLHLLYNCLFSANVGLPPETVLLTVDGQEYRAADLPLSFIWTAGSSHEVTVPQQIEPGEGVRHLFTSWNDGITDASRTIKAGGTYMPVFDTQYYVNLASPFGSPEGSGWYDKGSKAQLSVQPSDGVLIRRHFQAWSGDVMGNDPVTEIEVDGAKFAGTRWEFELTGLYILSGALAALAILTTVFMRRYKTRLQRSGHKN